MKGSDAITDLIFGDGFRAKLKFKEGSILQDKWSFSDRYETLNADRPLEINGTLKNLNIDRWISTLSDFPEFGISKKFLDHNIRFGGASIRAENLVVGGISFGNTKIGITRNLDSWTSHFKNERLIGQLNYWDNNSKPIAIHLDKLVLDSWPENNTFSMRRTSHRLFLNTVSRAT